MSDASTSMGTKEEVIRSEIDRLTDYSTWLLIENIRQSTHLENLKQAVVTFIQHFREMNVDRSAYPYPIEAVTRVAVIDLAQMEALAKALEGSNG